MIQKYDLSADTLPTLPVPHDCLIKEIAFEGEFLVLKFEDDISYHDSVKHINPNAVSLTIRIHLHEPVFNACLDVYEYRSAKFLRKEGYYRIDEKKLPSLCSDRCQNRVAYIDHYIGFEAIIIKLYCGDYYLLDIASDYVELHWAEE